MPRQLRVFLCHASQDKPTVWKLHRYLKQHGIKPWLDQEDLLPGEDWEVEIPKALFASDVILVCLSKNSVNKEGMVQKEITFALDKALEKPEGTIFIIPVKLEECNIPKRLSRYQWVDLSRTDGRKRLLMGLNKRVNDLSDEVQQIILEDVRQRKSNLKPIDISQIDRETQEKIVEKADREIIEEALHEKWEQEQKETIEREAAEKTEREKLERETAAKAKFEKLKWEAVEKIEREAAEKTAREKDDCEEAERVAPQNSSEPKIIKAEEQIVSVPATEELKKEPKKEILVKPFTKFLDSSSLSSNSQGREQDDMLSGEVKQVSTTSPDFMSWVTASRVVIVGILFITLCVSSIAYMISNTRANETPKVSTPSKTLKPPTSTATKISLTSTSTFIPLTLHQLRALARHWFQKKMAWF